MTGVTGVLERLGISLACCEPQREETAILQECCAPKKDMDLVHAELMEWREHHLEMEEAARRRKESADRARKYIDGVVQFNSRELQKLSRMSKDSLYKLQTFWGSTTRAVMLLQTPLTDDPGTFSPHEDDDMKRFRMDPRNYKIVLVNDAFTRITGLGSHIGHNHAFLFGKATDTLKLKVLEMSLSRSVDAKIHNLILYLRSEKKETPVMCNVTYVPLNDQFFNPVYHCLSLETAGVPSSDVLRYEASKADFAGACKKTQNMINVVRARDPDVQASRIGRALEVNQQVEKDAAQRRRQDTASMPITLRRNPSNCETVYESRVICGDDSEKGKVRNLTRNPKDVMDDKGGSGSRDPHFRKLMHHVGNLETKRYQRAVEAGFLIRNDPAELGNLARTAREIRQVHGTSHPSHSELQDKLRQAKLKVSRTRSHPQNSS